MLAHGSKQLIEAALAAGGLANSFATLLGGSGVRYDMACNIYMLLLAICINKRLAIASSGDALQGLHCMQRSSILITCTLNFGANLLDVCNQPNSMGVLRLIA